MHEDCVSWYETALARYARHCVTNLSPSNALRSLLMPE